MPFSDLPPGHPAAVLIIDEGVPMSSSAEYAPPSASASAGRPYVIAGFICAAVAVFLIPIVLGPAAIVLGIVAHRKRDPLGRWVIVAGVVGLALGLALGALVLHKVKQQQALAPVHAAVVHGAVHSALVHTAAVRAALLR